MPLCRYRYSCKRTLTKRDKYQNNHLNNIQMTVDSQQSTYPLPDACIVIHRCPWNYYTTPVHLREKSDAGLREAAYGQPSAVSTTEIWLSYQTWNYAHTKHQSHLFLSSVLTVITTMCLTLARCTLLQLWCLMVLSLSNRGNAVNKSRINASNRASRPSWTTYSWKICFDVMMILGARLDSLSVLYCWWW